MGSRTGFFPPCDQHRKRRPNWVNTRKWAFISTHCSPKKESDCPSLSSTTTAVTKKEDNNGE